MNLLILAAAGALCLAVAMWIALVAARWLRHRSSVRRRQSRAGAGLAIAEYCGDGDVDALGRKLALLPAGDVIAVTGRALPALSRPDRHAVGIALGRSGISAQIRRGFERAHENKRVLHCELMAAIGDADAAAMLKHGLRDRAPAVRIAAAIALVHISQAPALADLLELLGKRARESSRLVLLLEKLVHACEADIVQLVMNGGAEPRLRISALHALELAGAPTHRALLLRLGAEPSPQLAAAAARALARHGGADAGAVLIALLSHPAPEARREAAAALGTSGLAAARPALIRLTRDPDPIVAAAAARSTWLLRRKPDPHDLPAAAGAGGHR